MGGNEIKVDFLPGFKRSMVRGNKVITSRPEKLGEKGDWFQVFGNVFILTSIIKIRIWIVANYLYQLAGKRDPGSFKRTWRDFYGQYDPDQWVYLHVFVSWDWLNEVV